MNKIRYCKYCGNPFEFWFTTNCPLCKETLGYGYGDDEE